MGSEQNTLVFRQQLPIFPDTPASSRMEKTFNWPVKDNSSHSTSHLPASTPDSGIPQASPCTPLSFQSDSPVNILLQILQLALTISILQIWVLDLETLEHWEIFPVSGMENDIRAKEIAFHRSLITTFFILSLSHLRKAHLLLLTLQTLFNFCFQHWTLISTFP